MNYIWSHWVLGFGEHQSEIDRQGDKRGRGDWTPVDGELLGLHKARTGVYVLLSVLWLRATHLRKNDWQMCIISKLKYLWLGCDKALRYCLEIMPYMSRICLYMRNWWFKLERSALSSFSKILGLYKNIEWQGYLENWRVNHWYIPVWYISVYIVCDKEIKVMECVAMPTESVYDTIGNVASSGGYQGNMAPSGGYQGNVAPSGGYQDDDDMYTTPYG